jgi:hypothetical protein
MMSLNDFDGLLGAYSMVERVKGKIEDQRRVLDGLQCGFREIDTALILLVVVQSLYCSVPHLHIKVDISWTGVFISCFRHPIYFL